MKREIRASNLTAISGVGAIVDIAHESFLIPGIEQWNSPSQENHERIQKFVPVKLPRMEQAVGKKLFRFIDDGATLLVSRFPKSMFCEKCRSIVRWKSEYEREDDNGNILQPTCIHPSCNGKMVPMRFVGACEAGHVTDIDWRLWAHSGTNANRECRADNRLKFYADKKGAGLAHLTIFCDACKSYRDLKDLTNPYVTEKFLFCYSHHPWIYNPSSERCNYPLRILQKGATNIYYPKVISAFDIPSASSVADYQQITDEIRERLEKNNTFSRTKKLFESSKNAPWLEQKIEEIAKKEKIDKSLVIKYLSDNNSSTEPESKEVEDIVKIQLTLQEDEIETFKNCLLKGGARTEHFYAEKGNIKGHIWLEKIITNTLLLHKIREVRAFTGFQRVKPSDTQRIVPPDLAKKQDWLPVSEVFGEGILLQFNLECLKAWASQLPKTEMDRFIKLEAKRQEQELYFLPEIDPIYILIHTISHLLIRQLAFESGYSSSSLREKIYYDTKREFVGILIYTTDSDSEGSLGGLVAQGENVLFNAIVVNALEKGQWCSADPVCSETSGQGLGGFNHAACHNCTLLPETSCMNINTELDRSLIFSHYGLLKYLGVEL